LEAILRKETKDMSHRSLTTLLFVAMVFVGAGCETKAILPAVLPTAPAVSWEDMGDGVARRESEFGTRPSKGKLLLYRFPAAGFSWRFEHSTSSAVSVREWFDHFPDSVMATNGVYFHEDLSPSGAFVSKGESISERSFDADKSGLLVLSPSLRIIDTTKEPAPITSFEEAAQTYPFLIKDGVEAISEDSGKLAERTFIGTDADGNGYLGVVINDTVSLHELMRLLKEQPIAWDDALNLDGGPSTGYFTRFDTKNEGRNSLTPVPNVILVTPIR
jgi:uncharacterized protein YigE (DUF2233 family)